MCTEKTSPAINPLEAYSKQLSHAIDLIKDAYQKAGFQFPDEGVRVEVPIPDSNKLNQCVMRRQMICNENHCCVMFTTWDCGNRTSLPPGSTALVSCQYGGQPYSEGAIIPIGGGKVQRCENRGGSNTEGEWVVRDVSTLKRLDANSINQAMNCHSYSFIDVYYTVEKVNGQFVLIPHYTTTERTDCVHRH